jgi:hypothetical protein
MKIFWWQLGLHIEPENKEEQAALCLLLDKARFTSIGAVQSSEVTSIGCEQLTKFVGSDH